MARAAYWMLVWLPWPASHRGDGRVDQGKATTSPRRSTEEELPMAIAIKWNPSVNTIARNLENIFQSIRGYQ